MRVGPIHGGETPDGLDAVFREFRIWQGAICMRLVEELVVCPRWAGVVAADTFGGSVWLALMSWAALGCCRLVPGLGSARGSWG